ncbi:MAG: hypothetical protein WD080_01820 [Egibacteraceae bacterium]
MDAGPGSGRRAVRPAIAVLLTLALVGGCGDDLASSETVTAYFEAYASNDPDRHPEMLEAAQEGSPAHRFAAHHANVAMARAADPDRPTEVRPGTMEVVGDMVRIAYGPDRDQTRGHADFAVDEQTGRLRSFSESLPAGAERRVPVADTLSGGDGATVSVFDATVSLLSARKPAWSPQLGIVLEVRSGDQPLRLNAEDRSLVTAPGDAPDGGATTTYRTADGDAQVLHSVTGMTEVAADTTVVLLLVFEDVGLGGTVVLPIGSQGELIEAEIPVAGP